ncbi:MAG: hypothetical protein KTR32_42415 [Granulosicoccus sp.]|nr:hypothetical protein [Granulosicoccus sp.]
MKRFTYELDSDLSVSPNIGLVILQTDESMEYELKRWLPADYRIFHTRIANDQSIGSDSLQAMKARLPDSLSLLPEHTPFDVIAYGCTSATTVIGESGVESAIRSVFPKAGVTNPLTAIKAQLTEIGAERIALLTPYVPEVSEQVVTHLKSCNFDIAVSGSFYEALDYRVARISQSSLIDAITQLSTDSHLEAIVVTCTNLRTYELIDKARELCGCPVISSNSAMAWHIQALINNSCA